jgi:FkbM family methyltransferase
VGSLEAWLVEKEIFQEGIYDGVFDLANIRTFADLGCNRGFFGVWLSAKTRSDLKGILVEANPFLIPEIQALLKMNHFSKMQVLQGAAGGGMGGGEVEILIPPTDVGAGLKATTEKSLAGDKCEVARVPALRVGEVWRQRFPNGERCGILKIDIEGAEKRFFEDEGDFLSLVDRVVVEVHESMVSIQEIRELISKNGFVIKKENKEDSETALVFAERK